MKTLYEHFIFSCLLHTLPIPSSLSYMPWSWWERNKETRRKYEWNKATKRGTELERHKEREKKVRKRNYSMLEIEAKAHRKAIQSRK